MSNENARTITIFSGAARLSGTTNWLTAHLMDSLAKYKDENTVINKIDLYNYDIKPISRDFLETSEQKIPADGMKQLIPMILTSKVIILATPIYWFSVSGIMKNFMDRWYDFSDAKGKLNLDGKGIAILTAHANPSASTAYPVFKMTEETAKFCNMVYLGGVNSITGSLKGSNEYEMAVLAADMLANRTIDFLRLSKY